MKKHSEPTTTASTYGTYTIEVSRTDNAVNFIRSFTLNSGEYTLSHYPEFYEFIKSIKNTESKNYINLLLLE